MLLNINHHIWFKVCKPLRVKYNLCTNVVMVLNGAYVYCKVVNPVFTRYALLRFVSYYNDGDIKAYLGVLVRRGFIEQYGTYRNKPTYRISSLGLSVISDLNESYEKRLNSFVSSYGVSL